ncbi:MAG: hypothetical protein KME52_01430 [Desmonostoc geniculatum HA4340-LM1]|nr:hypothetical protein [Desmonostoc geniculatum HA4340-LM1]
MLCCLAERSPYKKPHKQGDFWLWKSECVSVPEASRREAHRRYRCVYSDSLLNEVHG